MLFSIFGGFLVHIVWFKRDLRLLDHRPLNVVSKLDVVPLYIVEPSIWSYGDLSKRHFNFVFESLIDLQNALRAIGSELFTSISEIDAILDILYSHYGPFHLHSHMEHGLQHTYERDKRVRKWIDSHACQWTEYPSFAVVRYKKDPSRREFLEQWLKEPIYPKPKSLNLPSTIPVELSTNLTELKGFKIDGQDAQQAYKGGEQEAIKKARDFFTTRFKKYNVYINKPFYSPSSSSLLAPYITWGNISLKALHIATRRHLDELKILAEKEGNDFNFKQLEAFSQRLLWHCSFIQGVERNPKLHLVSNDPRFNMIRQHNPEKLNAFRMGCTGIPFVDACIKALNQTGWVNFKQRAMLASFACNTLLLDWKDVGLALGNLWNDYDPGIHWMQMQTQSGLFPRSHIPLYDVIKQSKMHDPKGEFIKKYLPELINIDADKIHEPWLLEMNPYIQPIMDYRKQFSITKEILYAIKKKDTKE